MNYGFDFYNSKLAEHFESAVAAILFKHVMDICESSQVSSFECKGLQFSLGFSDVEYYSALKTLREKKDAYRQKYQGGGKVYTPLYELLSGLLEQINNGPRTEHKARSFSQ